MALKKEQRTIRLTFGDDWIDVYAERTYKDTVEAQRAAAAKFSASRKDRAAAAQIDAPLVGTIVQVSQSYQFIVRQENKLISDDRQIQRQQHLPMNIAITDELLTTNRQFSVSKTGSLAKR